MRSYSVPDSCLSLGLGSHYSPGYFRGAAWLRTPTLQPTDRLTTARWFPLVHLDQADNLRRLVIRNDDSDMSLISYPCPTLLGGIPS